MKRDEKTDLAIPSVATLDHAMRQRHTLLHALEAALHACVTSEDIPPTVVWQAVDELCAKTLAILATHTSQNRRDQLASIGNAIQDLDDHTCSWLRTLRGE